MSTTIQNLSTRQTMLGLAYLAYTDESTPSVQVDLANMANTINTTLPTLNPAVNWEVVWGPAIYTTPGSVYQDNMMYVAQDTNDKSNFAVAIRGTNSISDLDWLLEDLDVLQMMAWPFDGLAGTPGSGQNISESTSIDLQLVLNNMPSALYNGTSNSTALSLVEFLQTQTSSAINLYITGHSLGGCIAGTLALYLKQNVPDWDKSGSSIVSCVTFAAPTAGDAGFASLTDNTFLNGPYPAGWDTSLGTSFDAVRCTLDIVPMGWVADQVYDPTNQQSPIFSIYASAFPGIDFTQSNGYGPFIWSELLQQVFPDLAGLVATQNYTQPVAGATMLSGTINANCAYASQTAQGEASIQDTFAMFMRQASYQHSNSYPTILGVQNLTYTSTACETQLVANKNLPQASKKPSIKPLIPGLLQFAGKVKK